MRACAHALHTKRAAAARQRASSAAACSGLGTERAIWRCLGIFAVGGVWSTATLLGLPPFKTPYHYRQAIEKALESE